MAQEIADSKLLDTWGSSGTKIEPDISKIIEGWQLGEQPPHEYMNWLQNTFGSKLNHILKNGIAEWNNETEYLAGSSVKHSGNVWICETTNTNSEPTDLNATWEKVAINKDLTLTVDTVDDLRSISYPANTVWASGYHAKNDGAFGSHIFRLKGVKTTETDNGGTVIIATIGGVDYVYELQYNGAVNVKWFGVKGDGVTDDSVSIQNVLIYSYNNAPQTSWRYATLKIYFPAGKYKVTQSNYLFTGLTNGTFNIVGDGYGKTTILYAPTETTSDKALINNNQIFGFTTFDGITFEGTGLVDNWFAFNVGGGGGATQSISYNKCKWVGFPNLVKTTGTSMASEMTYNECKITGFSGDGFSINNGQSVNIRFLNTDIESFTGTLFKYFSGSNISFYQGSVIPQASGVICKIDSTANTSSTGSNNNPLLTCNQTRFELRDNSKLIVNSKSGFYANFIFNQCGMGGYNLASQDANNCCIDIIDNTNIYINECFNLQNYRVRATAVNATSNLYKSSILFKDCDQNAQTILKNSASFITSSGSNTLGLPIFIDIRNGNKTIYNKHGNSKYTSMDKKVTKTAGTEAKDRGYISSWVVNTSKDVWTEDLSYSRVSNVTVEIDPSWAGGYGGQTFTIKIMNLAKTTTFATGTLNTTNGLSLSWTPTTSRFFDLNDGIVVEFTPTTLTNSTFGFEGRLYITN